MSIKIETIKVKTHLKLIPGYGGALFTRHIWHLYFNGWLVSSRLLNKLHFWQFKGDNGYLKQAKSFNVLLFKFKALQLNRTINVLFTRAAI